MRLDRLSLIADRLHHRLDGDTEKHWQAACLNYYFSEAMLDKACMLRLGAAAVLERHDSLSFHDWAVCLSRSNSAVLILASRTMLAHSPKLGLVVTTTPVYS